MNNTPNYTIRRILAATILIFVGWMIGTVTVNVAKAIVAPAYECDEFTHIVAPGDTMWSIAKTYCEGHIGQAVYDLTVTRDTNDVYVGEVITNK